MKSRIYRKAKQKIKSPGSTVVIPTKEQTMILLADLVIDSFLELRNKKKDDIVKASSTK